MKRRTTITIARRENCIIIGWGGAYVIPHHPRMVNLYFHAPLRFRIGRVMELYDITDKEQAGQTNIVERT